MNTYPTAAQLREHLGARGSNVSCPAHDDQHGSLSIHDGTDGRPLVHCHAGCTQEAVISALRASGIWPQPNNGLTVAALAAAKQLPEQLLRESGFADDESYGRPVVRIDYRGGDGKVICTRYRGSIGTNGGGPRFWFRKGDKQQLFGLWRLRATGGVLLVEGETDTLALWDAGFNAVGVPGAEAWKDARFATALERCPEIYVHLEPDNGGQKFRAAFERSKLRERVRFCTVAPAAKDPCELRAKDPVGFRAAIEAALQAAEPAGQTISDTFATAPDRQPLDGIRFWENGDVLPPPGVIDDTEIPDEAYANEPEAQAEKGQHESQSSTLVKFVTERCELVHDENCDVYAIDRQTREVRHIERRAFRYWLHAGFYASTGKAARLQSVSEALQTLAGIGRHDGKLIAVHIRCAAHGGGYVLDLGEPGNSRAIRIMPGFWQIVDEPGVMFVRPESLRPLPEPLGGGDLQQLWQLVNVPESLRLLVLVWLLDSLRPDTPFPLLELLGEQGSAKSATQSLLCKLIDPSTVDLRSAPKNSEDVFVGAAGGWLLAYDNVSHLSAELQDTLCRIATGATHATRKFYTNSEESTIRAKRPVSINGIGAAITAQDLVNRTLSVELPTITDRRERGEIERAFEAQHARLLGALLDLFTAAMARLPAIQISRDRRPRLIEFATLGCAISEALGKSTEDFLRQYESTRAESISRTIDASPVATALMSWLEDRSDRYGEYTVKGLFDSLTRPQGGDSWPRSPKGFADALRRIAPALRTFGIEVRLQGKRGGQNRVSVTQRNKAGASPEGPASPDGGEVSRTFRTCRTSSDPISRDDRDEVSV